MNENQSRYSIGIDLGTTNSVVSYIDTASKKKGGPPVRIFRLPQLVTAERIEDRPLLPSFLYIPGPYDAFRNHLSLPWNNSVETVIGVFARDHGSQIPGRLVSSAKSWLCHGGVDRSAPILPWGGPEDVEKISPVTASAAYLSYIRDAWNHIQQDKREPHFFEEQDIVLTVPASFDEVARELTLHAAIQAGLKRVTLLEEPLAAFYAWLHNHEEDWETLIKPNELILICDIGGGTTDFSLITLVQENKRPRFRRVAVGEHLLLGGDNMDATLARHIEQRLTGRPGKLDSARWHSLCHLCRQAKEAILSNRAVKKQTITLMGRGAALIGDTLQAELTNEDVMQIVLEGFFPALPWDEAIKTSAGRAGLAEWGLPYAADPCITRHLALFLKSQSGDKLQKPACILFNGGAMTPPDIRQQVTKTLGQWFADKDQATGNPRVLKNESINLAVAQGAAYYGRVRQGRGIRIGAGIPRSYYIRVGDSEEKKPPGNAFPVVCVVERDMEEGEEATLDRSFEAWANKPVRFDLFSSTVRSEDKIGDLLNLKEDQLHQLPPVCTVLRFGKKTGAAKLPVLVKTRLTEVGTLALWCESQTTPHCWQLHFDLRRDERTGPSSEEITIEEESLAPAIHIISATFTPPSREEDNPASVVKMLQDALNMAKEAWPLSAARRMAEELIESSDGRSLGPSYEARWLNLAGWLLRPGFGHPLDSWKIKEVWKIFPQGLYFENDAQSKAEWWILWRRIAGGLEAGHQLQIFERIRPYLLGQKQRGKSKSRAGSQELTEMWRTVASLERLPVEIKSTLADTIVNRIKGNKVDRIDLWCLRRLGARVPFYGPLDRVVPKEAASRWIEKLFKITFKDPQPVGVAIAHMARKCGDRERDLDEHSIERILAWLSAYDWQDRCRRLILERTALGAEETSETFGESLPAGLTLVQ